MGVHHPLNQSGPVRRAMRSMRFVWALSMVWICGLASGLCASGLAWANAPRGPASAWQWAQVQHITDGDTLWVWPHGAKAAIKLRLLGLDAPEICQFWGPQSRAALVSLLPQGLWVMVHRQTQDTYGRELAEVWANGLHVSSWMVLNGHAWADDRQPRMQLLQKQAQWARRGLFGSPAVRPQDFRKWRGPCHGT